MTNALQAPEAMLGKRVYLLCPLLLMKNGLLKKTEHV